MISGCGGRSVEVSKLTLESSVRASMLMVRQASLSVALVCCWMMDMAVEGVRPLLAASLCGWRSQLYGLGCGRAS